MQLPLRVACKSHSRCTGVCVSSLDDVKVGAHGRTVSCMPMEGDSQLWNSLLIGDTVIPIGTSTHRIDSANVLTHLRAENHRIHCTALVAGSKGKRLCAV